MSLEAIYNKLSIKYNTDQKKIKQIIEDLFSEIRKSISSNVYPKILLRNLGSFIPNEKKLKKQIIRFYNSRENKSYGYYEATLEKIDSYLRIKKEKKEVDTEIEELKNQLRNEIHTRSKQPE